MLIKLDPLFKFEELLLFKIISSVSFNSFVKFILYKLLELTKNK